MTSKQTQRASARKAQARRQKVAQQRAKSAARASPSWDEPRVDLTAALDIGPEDYLPNGKVKLSAALLRITGTVAAATGVRDAVAFSQMMKIAATGWNLAVLQQFPDLHPAAAASVQPLLNRMDPMQRSLVEIFCDEKKRQFRADQRLVIEVIEERRNGAPSYAVPNIDPDEQPGAKGRGG